MIYFFWVKNIFFEQWVCFPRQHYSLSMSFNIFLEASSILFYKLVRNEMNWMKEENLRRTSQLWRETASMNTATTAVSGAHLCKHKRKSNANNKDTQMLIKGIFDSWSQRKWWWLTNSRYPPDIWSWDQTNKGLKVGFHSWKELIRAKGRLALYLIERCTQC